ncbi:hypothetical protein [Haloarcula sp. Atlit-120R]|uniref:hypothetical protein n=1 Tax=Haloarcula sp. Atlit-120R TaxID=2282135 RepID=UPI000EF176D6|nr:hypothetical protein [Haloarcula sp. Atlit-120R]RLM32654.1 hypothetical protein DVK01_20495 [Haloarcula sp. Atlit-120R]
MSIYGTDTPLDRAYNFYVRVQIAGIDCYSIVAETRDEAESLRAILDSADGVQETEVVES